MEFLQPTFKKSGGHQESGSSGLYSNSQQMAGPNVMISPGHMSSDTTRNADHYQGRNTTSGSNAAAYSRMNFSYGRPYNLQGIDDETEFLYNLNQTNENIIIPVDDEEEEFDEGENGEDEDSHGEPNLKGKDIGFEQQHQYQNESTRNKKASQNMQNSSFDARRNLLGFKSEAYLTGPMNGNNGNEDEDDLHGENGGNYDPQNVSILTQMPYQYYALGGVGGVPNHLQGQQVAYTSGGLSYLGGSNQLGNYSFDLGAQFMGAGGMGYGGESAALDTSMPGYSGMLGGGNTSFYDNSHNYSTLFPSNFKNVVTQGQHPSDPLIKMSFTQDNFNQKEHKEKDDINLLMEQSQYNANTNYNFANNSLMYDNFKRESMLHDEKQLSSQMYATSPYLNQMEYMNVGGQHDNNEEANQTSNSHNSSKASKLKVENPQMQSQKNMRPQSAGFYNEAGAYMQGMFELPNMSSNEISRLINSGIGGNAASMGGVNYYGGQPVSSRHEFDPSYVPVIYSQSPLSNMIGPNGQPIQDSYIIAQGNIYPEGLGQEEGDNRKKQGTEIKDSPENNAKYHQAATQHQSQKQFIKNQYGMNESIMESLPQNYYATLPLSATGGPSMYSSASPENFYENQFLQGRIPQQHQGQYIIKQYGQSGSMPSSAVDNPHNMYSSQASQIYYPQNFANYAFAQPQQQLQGNNFAYAVDGQQDQYSRQQNEPGIRSYVPFSANGMNGIGGASSSGMPQSGLNNMGMYTPQQMSGQSKYIFRMPQNATPNNSNPRMSYNNSPGMAYKDDLRFSSNNTMPSNEIKDQKDLHLTEDDHKSSKQTLPPNSLHINSLSSVTNQAILGTMLKSSKKIGLLTIEERAQKIRKYKEKRNRRNFKKRITYDCRKRVADNRKRLKGRFITKNQAAEIGKSPKTGSNKEKSGDIFHLQSVIDTSKQINKREEVLQEEKPKPFEIERVQKPQVNPSPPLLKYSSIDQLEFVTHDYNIPTPSVLPTTNTASEETMITTLIDEEEKFAPYNLANRTFIKNSSYYEDAIVEHILKPNDEHEEEEEDGDMDFPLIKRENEESKGNDDF